MFFFENDTVKTDCPVQIFRRMLKYLKTVKTVGLPYYFYCFFLLEILKNQALKMTIKLVIFRASFSFQPRPYI